MPNAKTILCRLSMLALLAAAICVHRAQAQSWTVQTDTGSQAQVDHNPDGSWTVTPEGGEPTTYGADNAESMVNDYGINSGDFSSMQSQAGSDDNAASGEPSDGAAASGDNGGSDDSSAAAPDSGDEDSGAMGGDSGGGDDSSGDSGGDSGGGDSGGGDSGGGDSGGGDSGD
jgi:hypothetical protein